MVRRSNGRGRDMERGREGGKPRCAHGGHLVLYLWPQRNDIQPFVSSTTKEFYALRTILTAPRQKERNGARRRRAANNDAGSPLSLSLSLSRARARALRFITFYRIFIFLHYFFSRLPRTCAWPVRRYARSRGIMARLRAILSECYTRSGSRRSSLLAYNWKPVSVPATSLVGEHSKKPIWVTSNNIIQARRPLLAHPFDVT